jgi:adenylyltransferase/sulfurtransferase
VKTAVILGVGGLGCPAALALSEAAPDVRLVLVDPDRVDRSNLPRQILFRDSDVGLFKSEVAARRLRNAEARVQRFEAASADAILKRADILIDGTDDYATRFFANDEAVRRGIPLVLGAVLGWTGQLLGVQPGRTACLRCLFEGPPSEGPTCAQAGVFAPLCGLVGAAMAALGASLLAPGEKKIFFSHQPGTLYRWDARTGAERPLPLKRDPACAACHAAAS